LEAAPIVKFFAKRGKAAACALVIESHAELQGIAKLDPANLNVSILIHQEAYVNGYRNMRMEIGSMSRDLSCRDNPTNRA
jgi:hypothetical protein